MEDNTKNTIDKLREQGEAFVSRAMDCLKKEDYDEFGKNWGYANSIFDKLIKSVNADSDEMDNLYGESRNFGVIYSVIEGNSKYLTETKDGQKTLRKIYCEMKSDKNLHEQMKAFCNLTTSKHINNVNEYIDEAVSIVPHFNKDSIKESNEKLIKIINESKMDKFVDIPEDKLNLFEAVEYLTFNKKSLSNIDEYVSAKNVVAENISRNTEDVKPSTSYDKDVNDISESIANELNDSEVGLIESVMSSTDKPSLFENYQTETLTKVKKLMDLEKDLKIKERLSNIYERIEGKKFNEKNILADIAEMIEIQETIDE